MTSTPSTERHPPDLVVMPRAMRHWAGERRAAGRRLALVPTMGALHAGHLSLIDLAHRHADDVVVSIFVNPLQFNQDDDYATYPRPIDKDVAACAAAGAAAVYAPTAAAMYPKGFETRVQPGPLADVMEGAMRPGHFAGVTTVVLKLFAACRPHVAVFGEKDYQQLSIIRRMTTDFDLGIGILGAPIVREADGLAMSSRNTRLDAAQRVAARCVPRALDAAVTAVAGGERKAEAVEAVARAVVEAEPSARFEYATAFHPETLAPLGDLLSASRLAIAVWFGDVRLIDNVALT